MRKFISIFLIIVLVILTIIFAYTFVNRYTMPFNVEGNYYDENTGVSYQEQSVLVYGIITIILLLLTILTGINLKKQFT